MNIANWLFRTARRMPEAAALLRGAQVAASYAEFAARAGAVAAGLSEEYGILPGDRVGLYMGNSTQYLEALYGVWWAGAVAVPVNGKLHPDEAKWILRDAGARLVFAAEDAGLEGFETLSVQSDEYLRMAGGKSGAAPISRGDDDLAWLFYTSGTTGTPKGVMLSHGNLMAMSLSYLVDVDEVRTSDAALYAAPVSHGAGLYNFVHVLKGARHVVPLSGGFHPLEIIGLASDVGNLSMFAAPTMVHRLIAAAKRERFHGEGIKTIVYGGGPMYRADILDALAQFGNRFVQIYGQGESPMTITALDREAHRHTKSAADLHRLVSVGRAHSVVEVRVTGGVDGGPLPPGGVGEVEVRGSTVMHGYWNNEAATRAALRDGWLKTGDVGALDGDGYLVLSDRSKDVIISGGSNVYPREVEDVLLRHGDVREVSVIGRPHADWGEEVIACVVLHEACKLDREALDALCLANIARFKRPRDYVVLGALPKNNYGKVLKRELRERYADG